MKDDIWYKNHKDDPRLDGCIYDSLRHAYLCMQLPKPSTINRTIEEINWLHYDSFKLQNQTRVEKNYVRNALKCYDFSKISA